MVAGEGGNKVSKFKAYAAVKLKIPLFWEPTRRSFTEYRICKFLGNGKFEMSEKSSFDNPVFRPSEPASYPKRTISSTAKALTK